MFWTRPDRRVYRFIQAVEGRDNSLQISQALDKQRHILRLGINLPPEIKFASLQMSPWSTTTRQLVLVISAKVLHACQPAYISFPA